MCSNYQAVTRADRLLSFFDVFRSPDEPPLELQEEVWPTGLAPFVRRAEDGSGNRRVEVGHFGLVPSFAKELAFGRRTYNARSETVATLASFKHARAPPAISFSRVRRGADQRQRDAWAVLAVPIAELLSRSRCGAGLESFDAAARPRNSSSSPLRHPQNSWTQRASGLGVKVQ